MLKTRIITALLLLAGFLAMLFLLPFAGWLAFACLVAGLGGWEWAGLMKRSRQSRWLFTAACAFLTAALAWLTFDLDSGNLKQESLLWGIYSLAGLFWLVLVPVWLWAKWTALLPGLLAGGIVLVPACLALMQLRTFHPAMLLAWMAAVWVADIAAYFCGRAFGRHKLAPVISPGKTWEGALGALIGVMTYGLLANAVAGHFSGMSASHAMLAATLLLLTVVSILGDLFESLAKRQAGVKDSGTTLPGHGGVLDRIDSLTSTLPLAGLVMLAWDGRVP
jgi:phosphatidate cytidylyltransferase